MKQCKYLAILGSTGSIGTQTLQVVRKYPNLFKVFSLAAKSNIEKLQEQIEEFSPKVVAVYDDEKAVQLQKKISPQIKVVSGEEGLIQCTIDPKVETVVLAMTGSCGLKAAICAIEAKKQIALANKELLVCAGELITKLAKKKGVSLIPIDSEHNALFQCLEGQDQKTVQRLIITASGGPFRTLSHGELQNVTRDQALRHPRWNMGPKNTIDSSTLMNKGLEVIEAYWLFDCPIDQIEVVIHPQSIIHGMVEFLDGSILAHMAMPDMVLPIQYALSYPSRYTTPLKPYDFTKASNLTFEPPDLDKFICLDLACQALKIGKSMPCFMNAANEVLVERFLNHEIEWIQIGSKLKKLMTSHTPENVLTLDSVFSIDREAREKAWKS